MMRKLRRSKTSSFMLASIIALVVLFAGRSRAQNQIMGELLFAGTTDAEKTAGIWIDGQYVGYANELKGAKKVLVLPGEHELVARQAAHKDFVQKIIVEPGQRQLFVIALQPDPRVQLPDVTSQVELSVTPNRAAVFLDDTFVGHVHEFGGHGRRMLTSPGKHRIKVALPGFQTFETEINLLANQKAKIKTDLVKGSITQSGPLVAQK